MRGLRVHFLPELVPTVALVASHCAVIDVLRATTSIATALAAGATSVIPCLTIEDARQRAGGFAAGRALLAGERGGLPIEGFDLGNSPAEYTADKVAGKQLIMTTTNGTKALLHAASAQRIFVAAFVNLNAVVDALADHDQVDLLCAGTDGQITREDVLVAGAMTALLLERGEREINDSAAIALDAWHRIMAHVRPARVQPRLVEAFAGSRGGRNLLEIGMAADLESAAAIDRLTIVPEFLAARGEIVAI